MTPKAFSSKRLSRPRPFSLVLSRTSSTSVCRITLARVAGRAVLVNPGGPSAPWSLRTPDQRRPLPPSPKASSLGHFPSASSASAPVRRKDAGSTLVTSYNRPNFPRRPSVGASFFPNDFHWPPSISSVPASGCRFTP